MARRTPRSRLRLLARGAVSGALAVSLASCTGTTGTPDGDPSSSSATPGGGLRPGGTADRPRALDAGTDLLTWSAVPGPVEATVTRNSDWTLRVDEAGDSWTLDGPEGELGSSASARERISDALLDTEYAAVVFQDTQESRPSRAVVTELATGQQFTIDGDGDLPTTTGGSWALGQGQLAHATVIDGAYCLATVELGTRTSLPGWCAPARHGFNGVHLTPSGLSLMSFDDARPSCRTVSRVVGQELTAFPDVSACIGWEGLLLDDGAVWSVVPKAKQIENARVFARVGSDHYDLGAGTSGSLTWCAGSAYFVRDPQRDGDPARLLRWHPVRGLDVVYESPGGQAFLSAPRCGGDMVSVTALAEGGDEQVSAPVR